MWVPYCRNVKWARIRLPVILLILFLFPVEWGVSSQVEKTESLLLELKDEDWEVRRDAASELKRTAPEGKKVILALIEALKDDDSRVRRSAAEALGEIATKAKAAISTLIGMLRDEDPGVRQSTAEALGKIGAKAAPAIPTLGAMLQDKDSRIRRSAATALGEIGPRARSAFTSLLGALKDENPAVRRSAAMALGRIGRKDAISPLLETLKDEDSAVRRSAAEALGSFGKPAVPRLIKALRHGNPIYLQSVVAALGNVGRRAAPGLIKTLKNEDENLLVRQYSAMALARIGPEAREVVPALIESLKDEDSRIRRSAVGALGKIGVQAGTAIPSLVEVLKNQDEDLLVREYAATSLAKIGPQDQEVTLALIEALKDENPKVHEAAVRALVAIGPAAGEAPQSNQGVPALIGQLKDADVGVRRKACVSLGNTGSEARTAVPSLIEALEDEDGEVRRLAARALGLIGPYAKDGVPALVRVLGKDPDWEIRGAAALALGMIGPEAKAAVPLLIESLKEGEARFRGLALMALRRIGPPPKAPIPTLLEALKDGDLEVRGSAALSIQNFAKARLEQWRPLLSQSEAPVLRSWLARHEELYGIGDLKAVLTSRNGEVEGTDVFNVLGGRAAIRETLQMQLLDGREDQRAMRTIPLSEIRGVEVKSHPFEEMLKAGKAEPARLPLADFVPEDHLFIYFAGLPAFREFLDGSSEFLFRLGSAFSVNSIGYDLKSRYLARLGLDDEWLARLQEAKVIKEIGIVLPDLFLIDGTEITAIMKVSAMTELKPLLDPLGIGDLEGAGIVINALQSGRKAYWASRDDFLLVSTSRRELERVLNLHEKLGRGSLGQSAEFQYMMQQLPRKDETRVYLYFSDPFIRHLVGPGTKIAQLRRMQVRTDLERLTAGALLYRLDGHRGVPALSRLAELGYVPRGFAQGDYTLLENLAAQSEKFGFVAEMKSLGENPVELVSREEADAYKNYVNNYSRFWRQFFDPIAMRLDEAGDQTLELTTLILPLLDSEIYDSVRELLTRSQSGPPLTIPILLPEPAVMLSLNVSDSQRIGLTEKLTGALIQYSSVSPDILDSFGSAVHFAVQDSEPIVALGSGDILGALSEEMLRMEGLESLLPVLLTVLTRPCKLLVELKDPATVLNFLRRAGRHRSLDGGKGELYQQKGRDAWIYKLSVLGIIQLHLGLAIENGYLVISNLPWAQQTRVEGTLPVPLNGARLQLNLGTVSRQLPALHLKAYSDYRSAAVDGMGYLYPLLASGLVSSVADAEEKHLTLFGFKPVHPASGEWLWEDGELKSSLFGTPVRAMQPDYRPQDRAFGLFQKIDKLSVNMQLEETGLRTRIRWKLKKENKTGPEAQEASDR